MIMQADGNLVLSDTNESAPWNSGTSGHEGAYLVLGNEGTLSIYYPGRQTTWGREHVVPLRPTVATV
jgi:hypothetical protein